ncbi:MAG: spermidine/putrescine ABC transporter ATP-binding protein PotA [Candidatus Latescibacterota bacterium]|jgi:spermidine/putrescine transport system ATP-binding protein
MTGSRPALELRDLAKSYAGKSVLHGIDLTVEDGEFVTLLGPSGCGKTTILRLVAGLETPDRGEVRIDGQPVNGLPANQRPVNTVFQSYALFPHLTVQGNVAFGLRMRGVLREETRRRVEEALAMVQLEGFADRRPHQLSGGQQQRVALARAVVNRPRVLLLDECLNALDHQLRLEMEVELKQLQRRLGITFLFVTHDQEEALAMSDRVAVMEHGRIEQVGTPREVYESPRNRFVAGFVGEANLLPARVSARLDPARVEAELAGVACVLHTDLDLAPGAAVQVVLRPEDLRLAEVGPDEPPAGRLLGRVVERTYKGRTLDTVVALDGGMRLKVSEFFDEDDPTLDHLAGVRVAATWVSGWEVVLPDG